MSKRLDILKASLAKKEERFTDQLQDHFDTVKQANGQPLSDKRNGAATLNKWDKQRQSLRNAEAGIEKTKRAIENEEGKIAQVAKVNESLPDVILKRIETGELIQWRKHPNRFFVPGVDKARIAWDAKSRTLSHSYVKQVTDNEQYKKFAQLYNTLYNELKN